MTRAVAAARAVLLAGVLLGMMASGLLVWTASGAAFSGKSASPNSAWAAGTVTLSDDDGSSAMLSLTGVRPPTTGSECITVTYTGNVNAQVKVYATGIGGALRPYLTITVEQGTGGSSATCAGFGSSTTLWGPNTFDNFAATSWATGLGSWSPSAAGQTRTYRVTWSVVDDDNATSTSAGMTFTWEARSI